MKVILGVTGCIGAYKSALILRLLQQEGLDVVAAMTRSAQEFIGPLTLEKLSGNPVVTSMFGNSSSGIEHISLARESDLLLVAPATANILAKFARGIADDFLSTMYLSTSTPVMVAPAMNREMWNHPATQENMRVLRERGVHVVGPESGYQACGEVGEGRLAEPETIVAEVLALLRPKGALTGKRVLITAGPTVEDIDPVRFLSNRSSGKMGYAIARKAVERGALVQLVSGPTSLPVPAGLEFVPVRSASQMAEAVLSRADQVDVFIAAAAVSDFTPEEVQPQKVKKGAGQWVLKLRSTTDILAAVANEKGNRLLVGFAAESENVLENAGAKLKKKKLDLIVANDISRPDSGFGVDLNAVTLLDKTGSVESFPAAQKDRVAGIILDRIERLLNAD